LSARSCYGSASGQEINVPEADPTGRTVGQVGEDPLVAEVITRYPGADWLTVGPGDDAAVLDLAGRFAGPLVVGTDTLVEHQDFRRDWSSARDVGIKTAAQNFADLAAMGAVPHTLLVSLTTPASVPADWARELADGLAEECTRAGAVVAGGDLSAGTELVITGTALGTLSVPRAVLRSGARPGDVLAVAGVVGRSAAGWALLLRGHGLLGGPPLPPALARLVDDHRRPRPPYAAGPEAALAGATAMIDTSDGLVRDAERLARASGVTLDLAPQALAPDADLLAAADFLTRLDGEAKAVEAMEWVLTGGEDHALLATFPPGVALPPSFRRIGTVRPAEVRPAEVRPADVRTAEVRPAVLLAGEPIAGPGGWRHFA
jgi:thiamine-monophosphate kinase